ncbi:LytR/AlgR family response regulator transcription factor [Salinibius halmophilus]|uniref:LytR/AlgR family response regulator transcription factor n=1 Tax=Salinibius halmophilus TaxID=1853216 RepID=UPI000E66AF9E|nr:LytTR family DNA-binding domain-containing protein [Salinibius halmophilus]
MQIVILDDEPLASSRLAEMVTTMGHQAIVAANAEDAKSHCETADVALIDIEMPGINGLQLSNQLACPVIFCTAHEQYALDAFNQGALHYLTKPIRQHRLQEALARVPVTQDVLRLPSIGGIWQLAWQNVLYAYAQNKQTFVVSKSGEKPMNCSLQELEALHANKWLRISRSTLINPQQVLEFSGDRIILAHQNIQLSVSRRQRAVVTASLRP